MRHHAAQDSTKPRAPIAQVLNDIDSAQDVVASPSSLHVPQAAPFGGKLADLLLETPDRLQPNERRRTEHQYDEPLRTAGENPVFKLPLLPQLPAKTAERNRIPPLLQGLHQPPPLPPSSRLFPPITDGASGFEQDIRDRIQSQEARVRASKEIVLTRPDEVDELNDVDAEHDNDGEDEAQPTQLAQTQYTDIAPASIDDGIEALSPAEKPKGKKRKRWSDDETRDLLLGVSRFGIGKWKRILQCPDYTFHGRTAVDLKDRFRVCCPPEGSKARRQKRQGAETDDALTSARAVMHLDDGIESHSEDGPSNRVSSQKEPLIEGGHGEPLITNPKLLELGINTPFARSTRRPRRRFTSQDDENLRKGFEKYGAAWHSMRDDKELGFDTRHPTDLRDRFRIRYPEAYSQAGYKAKNKIKPRLRERLEPSKQTDTMVPSSESDQIPPPPEPKKKPSLDDTAPEEAHASESTARPSGPVSSTTKHQPAAAPMSYPTDPTSTFSFSDLLSATTPPDKDAPFSPMILHRHIHPWADAPHAFLMPHTTRPTTPTPTSSYAHPTHHDSLDMSMQQHLAYPNDGLHIDPMATLHLPLMAMPSPHRIPWVQNTGPHASAAEAAAYCAAHALNNTRTASSYWNSTQ
ncbi:hypothetical protein ACEQ8H_007872 [Pleosporales sp. CAS-2024a]